MDLRNWKRPKNDASQARVNKLIVIESDLNLPFANDIRKKRKSRPNLKLFEDSSCIFVQSSTLLLECHKALLYGPL